MSVKMEVKFEVTNLNVMRDTLTELGHVFTELDEVLTVSKAYHPIMIDTKSGQISCDSAQKDAIRDIKRQYMVNFYRDQAIQEGMSIEQTVDAEGNIEIYFTR